MPPGITLLLDTTTLSLHTLTHTQKNQFLFTGSLKVSSLLNHQALNKHEKKLTLSPGPSYLSRLYHLISSQLYILNSCGPWTCGEWGLICPCFLLTSMQSTSEPLQRDLWGLMFSKENMCPLLHLLLWLAVPSCHASWLWWMHSSLHLTHPPPVGAPASPGLVQCENQPTLSLSLQGSRAFTVGEKRPRSSAYTEGCLPLGLSTTQREGPKSSIWSVHFFVYSSLQKQWVRFLNLIPPVWQKQKQLLHGHWIITQDQTTKYTEVYLNVKVFIWW